MYERNSATDYEVEDVFWSDEEESKLLKAVKSVPASDDYGKKERWKRIAILVHGHDKKECYDKYKKLKEKKKRKDKRREERKQERKREERREGGRESDLEDSQRSVGRSPSRSPDRRVRDLQAQGDRGASRGGSRGKSGGSGRYREGEGSGGEYQERKSRSRRREEQKEDNDRDWAPANPRMAERLERSRSPDTSFGESINYEDQLWQIYRKNDPEKLEDPDFVATMLERYAGREKQLLVALEEKYRKPQGPDYVALVTEIYRKNNPEKLQDPNFIKNTLARYVGREAVLLATLEEKYQQSASDETPDYHYLVTAVYAKHNPEKLIDPDFVENTLARYAGREKVLLVALEEKYRKLAEEQAQEQAAQGLDYATLVTEIYRKNNPEKLQDPNFIKNTLARYVGREQTLLGALEEKYRNAPSPVATPTPADNAGFLNALTEIYRKNDPEKLEDPDFVANTLERYAGREKQLLAALEEKYRKPQGPDYVALVTEIYRKNNPEKLQDPNFIKNTLARYVGREEALLRALEQKYRDGPASTPPVRPQQLNPSTADDTIQTAMQESDKTAPKRGVYDPNVYDVTFEEGTLGIKWDKQLMVKVSSVVAGGHADRAGVGNGDVMVKVNGTNVSPTITTGQFEMLVYRASRPMTVTFKRLAGTSGAAGDISADVAGPDYNALITEIYRKNSPEKLNDPNFVSNTLEKYAGRERELLAVLQQKYKQAVGEEAERPDYAKLVQVIYEKNNPEKLLDPNFITVTLQRYAGREDILLGALQKKYAEANAPQAAAPAPAPVPNGLDYLALITAIYAKNEPEKLDDPEFVKNTLVRYVGREDALLAALTEKYRKLAADQARAAERQQAQALVEEQQAQALLAQQAMFEVLAKAQADAMAEAMAEAQAEQGESFVAPVAPDYAALVTEIYRKNNPEKLQDPNFIKNTLARYFGREHVLLGALQEKYENQDLDDDL
jgi:hypothetical protein